MKYISYLPFSLVLMVIVLFAQGCPSRNDKLAEDVGENDDSPFNTDNDESIGEKTKDTENANRETDNDTAEKLTDSDTAKETDSDVQLNPLTCSAPLTPLMSGSSYYHAEHRIDYDADTESWAEVDLPTTPIAISADGSRVAVVISETVKTPGTSDHGYRTLRVYTPGRDTPLWSYNIDKEFSDKWDAPPPMTNLDITADGRGIVVENGLGLLFFACDNPIPAWTFNGPDEPFITNDSNNARYAAPPKFTADGKGVFIWYRSTDGRNLFYLLDTNTGHVRYRFYFDFAPKAGLIDGTYLELYAAVSGDGSHVAVMTGFDNPEDPEGSGWNEWLMQQFQDSGVDAYAYSHSRIMLYERGELMWTDWLRNDCDADCYNFFELPFRPILSVHISEDGSRITGAGPAGRIVQYSSEDGSILWQTIVHVPNDIASGETYMTAGLDKVQVSSDGRFIVALVVSGIIGYDFQRFDTNGEDTPVWSLRDQRSSYVDYSPNIDPSPNSIKFKTAPGFEGFRQEKITGVRMTQDGNMIAISDSNWGGSPGHIFMLYSGSPLPFQVLTTGALDGMTYLNSRFAMSSDGAWIAALSVNADDDNILRPKMAVHIFEVPPGLILDIKTDVTVAFRGDLTGTLIEAVADVDKADMSYHFVKPGRAAASMVFKLHLVNSIDEMLPGDAAICVPWDTTEKEVPYLIRKNGFYAQHVSMEWETPQCLWNYLNTMSEMVMRGELIGPDEIMYDQDYDIYFHAEIIMSES